MLASATPQYQRGCASVTQQHVGCRVLPTAYRRRHTQCAAAQGPGPSEDWDAAELPSSASAGPSGSSSSSDSDHLVFQPDLDFPPVLVQDWRTFRARLVAMESGQAARAARLQLGREERWAHVLAQPERGCLLVARRPGLGMFANTVILVLEHDDGEGSSGLVINMPTPLMISHLGLEEDIADAFGRCPLFIGGPVTKNLLHVLHGRREVEGSLEIVEGVFAGGVESASELVRRGEASPHDFMLLAGYSGWGPGQLAQELAEGTWLVVAASQAVILDCLQETLAWNPSPPPAAASPLSRMTGAGAAPLSSEDLKRSCWQRVLQQAGIEPHMLGML